MHTMHLAKLVYTSTLHYGLIVNQKGAIFWGAISVSFLKNDIFILMILQKVLALIFFVKFINFSKDSREPEMFFLYFFWFKLVHSALYVPTILQGPDCFGGT